VRTFWVPLAFVPSEVAPARPFGTSGPDQIFKAADAFLQEIGVERVAREALEAVFIDGRIKKLLAL
jgi:hypothetical protein